MELPLHHKSAKRENYTLKCRIPHPKTIWEKTKGWFWHNLSDRNSRNLLGFLALNFTFASVELFYGWYSNSLGLIADSFHMFFDCSGLIAGLVSFFSFKDNFMKSSLH